MLLEPLGHQISLVAFLAVACLVALSNRLFLIRLGRLPKPSRFPPVSVLIPARNEERKLGICLESLAIQDYPNFHVWVLDDCSKDRTGVIAAEYASRDQRFHVEFGRPLPQGWIGKHWACQQLADAHPAELLVFLDADTRLEPNALSQAVSAAEESQADLLSVVPRQEMLTWGERLSVPFSFWGLISFLPLGLAYRLRWPVLSLTVGQFMLFRQAAYQQVGGHAAVRTNAVDDIALGRKIKSAGLRWRLANGIEVVTCRMYTDLRTALDGFTKNMFPAFGYNIPIFLLVWAWLAILGFEPLAVLALDGAGLASGGFSSGWALAAVVFNLFLWAITTWQMRFPAYLPLFYPVILLINGMIGFRSMLLTLLGRASWKGRRMPLS